MATMKRLIQSNGKLIQGKCPIPINEIMRWLWVTRTMTQTVIPNKVIPFKYWDYRHIYSYIMKMVLLQKYYYVIGNIWILDLNMFDSTGDKLYCVADKIDPDKKENRNYSWKVRDILFSAQDIYNLTKSKQLPVAVMDTQDFILKINAIKQMEQIINTTTIKKLLFNENNPWHQVSIFRNQKQCNVNERRYQMLKKDFVNVLKNCAVRYITLIPILLFDNKKKHIYFVDGLWRLKVNDDLTIGISFRAHESDTNSIIASGIHLCVDQMRIHCQLIGRSVGNFFNGWRSIYNNMSIGQWENNDEELNYLRLLSDFVKQNYAYVYDKFLVERMHNDCTYLQQNNAKIKGAIQQTINTFDSNMQNDSLNRIVQAAKHEADYKQDEKDNGNINYNLRQFYTEANNMANGVFCAAQPNVGLIPYQHLPPNIFPMQIPPLFTPVPLPLPLINPAQLFPTNYGLLEQNVNTNENNIVSQSKNETIPTQKAKSTGNNNPKENA